MTLADAMRRAESLHPSVRAKEAQLIAAEGSRREASSLFFQNPAVSVERTRRTVDQPDGRANEWSAGLSQAIETGGQQGRRREAAGAGLMALGAEIDEARRQARSDAAARFHAVLAAQRRVLVEQRSLELFESTAQAVAKRLSAGEDTRLDSNVAVIEAERARNALALARELLLDARSELATAVQLPPDALPQITGELVPPGDVLPYNLSELLTATQMQPRQRALAAREEAARAKVGVERARRYPDVTVGLNVGREGPGVARERLTTISVSVPLPLFNRNDAAIGQAQSEATQAEIDRTTAVRDSQAQVRRLWSRLDSQRQRLQRLRSAMLSAAADNRQLAAKSRQAGQIGLLDQLLVNRQSLDAERELNDALAEFHSARIELEHATGWSQESSPK
ncbi:MAG: TolC family protein [Caldimonas sp.]